jgi:hypothetical protein
MSFGTSYTCNIYISRITIDSESHLRELIKDRELYLADIRDKILMFASATPKDIVPDEWKDEPISFIHNSVDDLLRDYDENLTELVNFNHCLRNYESGVKDE